MKAFLFKYSTMFEKGQYCLVYGDTEAEAEAKLIKKFHLSEYDYELMTIL